MSTQAPGPTRSRARFRPHALYVAATTLFAAVFVAVALSAFHAPSPHALPVGVVAPASVAGQVGQALDHGAPGGFDLRVYGSAAAARTAIAHGEVDGALVEGSGTMQLLVAPAAGATPTQAVTTAFTAVAAHAGQPLTVTDVVKPGVGDSMGLSPFFLVLGVLIPSVAVGSGSALVFRRSRPLWWLAAPVLAATAIGLATAGVADGVAGLGNYPALAGIVALFSLAVAAPTAALARIKPPLSVLAVLAFVVFGIPGSGGPSGLAPFGPAFLRALDPVLPLGLAAQATRRAVYFDGYGLAQPLGTLAAWAVAGLVVLAVVAVRRRGRVQPPQGAASTPLSYSGVVVGFDDSEPARRALAQAARLAAARHESLHVVYADHVVLETDLTGYAQAAIEATREETADAVAAAAAEIVGASGLDYTFERRREAPTDAILSAAADLTARGGSEPVIVVGRSGHAAHRFLGSVPSHLLARSPFPVLAIA
ncbi:universal stress protein [Actinospica durhamensis]|uniref:Universal stress protein n=1 Tax=Actinospica durhamensis TaxID=1508375 RepID=A0A941IPW5_9ACTN|nr:universal stress protein [Actinospica durhamensis]MBR7835589.1 universal stress protein [Actinospica durhamensis]